MKAACWYGTNDVRVEQVPDPKILNPRDAIIKITLTAICGSDLHLYDGFIPTMEKGDILGHEFMGEVVEVGSANHNLRVGDRVVVPFTIACGRCFFCTRDLWSACDNSNPNAWMLEKLYGSSGSGLFGYSHMMGGYAGGQAEYVRVPFADVGPIQSSRPAARRAGAVPVRHLPHRLHGRGELQHPAGRHGRGLGLRPGRPVRDQERLAARRRAGHRHRPAARAAADGRGLRQGGNDQLRPRERLRRAQGGDRRARPRRLHRRGRPRGARHGSIDAWYDKVKTSTFLATDRASALRQAIQACRKGGTVSIPGVYGGFVDKVPMGAAFGKGLTLKMGQTHVHRYLKPLLDRIERGEIDPSGVITHRISIDEIPAAYQTFKRKEDDCIKVVIKP